MTSLFLARAHVKASGSDSGSASATGTTVSVKARRRLVCSGYVESARSVKKDTKGAPGFVLIGVLNRMLAKISFAILNGESWSGDILDTGRNVILEQVLGGGVVNVMSVGIRS